MFTRLNPRGAPPGVFGRHCQGMGFMFGLASAKLSNPQISLTGGWLCCVVGYASRDRGGKDKLAHTACSARAVVAKMALDQLFWTPIALVLFFACFTLLEGRSMAYLRSQLRAKFLPTLVKGFALWPAAHLVNFRYVPNGMRILYVNMVQVRPFKSCLGGRAAAAQHGMPHSLSIWCARETPGCLCWIAKPAMFCTATCGPLSATASLRQLLWNVVLCRVATQELSPGPKRKLREEDAERRIDVEAQCSTQSIAMPTRR